MRLILFCWLSLTTFFIDAQTKIDESRSITFSESHYSIKQFIRTIEEQIELTFSYSDNRILVDREIKIPRSTISLKDCISILKENDIVAKQEANGYVLTPSKLLRLKISILDATTKQAIPGVYAHGGKDANLTNSNGQMVLQIPRGSAELTVKAMGYMDTIIPLLLDVSIEISIQLKPQTTFLNTVTLDYRPFHERVYDNGFAKFGNPNHVFAETEGFIVRNNMDTALGLIKIKDKLKSFPTTIEYAKSPSAVREVLNASQLIGFSVKKPSTYFNQLLQDEFGYSDSLKYVSMKHPRNENQVFMISFIQGPLSAYANVFASGKSTHGDNDSNSAKEYYGSRPKSFYIQKGQQRPELIKRKKFHRFFNSYFGDCIQLVQFLEENPSYKSWKKISFLINSYNFLKKVE